MPISPKEQYKLTLDKMVEAVRATKVNLNGAPKFVVLTFVPAETLAEFIIATSVTMQAMATAEFEANMNAQRAQQHSQGGTPDGK